jgi:bifunctional DNA-binding transcriptional regulator/antitoxin component of YhaV-PrlF toxin-antitoxin module
MALVKVKTRYQVTLPITVRNRAGVGVGDLLEAKVERGRITLTPKLLVEREIAEGLEDLSRGRVYGPFTSADEVVHSLHRNAKRLAARPRSRA